MTTSIHLIFFLNFETQITDLNNDNNRNIKAEGTAILQEENYILRDDNHQ